MNSDLIKVINQHKETIKVSMTLKEDSQRFTKLLFKAFYDCDTNAEEALIELESLFITIRNNACPEIKDLPCKLWGDFKDKIPDLYSSLKKDAEAIFNNDPASQSIEEIYLAYPGFFAISIYRMARVFYKLNLPLIPRLMTEYAHSITGIDIHPGADIGASFFIDHGTGVVIGETTEIYNNVKVYQGVTLGALTVKKEYQDTKRHPTIKQNVTIYANATILGGDTVIGENSVIGGNTWLTESVPENSIVTHNHQVEIFSKTKK
ncbi:serine acetyltransferase [Winogradskyella undariae]|uniref:serine O-acetyltransferase EpsC n=1 Tax=Winogradskyella TaxID=286104 RepID=UPI00156B49C2|nr:MULTISPECIES: serine O-acetyltransferase EpsC [Winogradskyella]NRR90291.1 serine acetyltransferase [Winogradskyella undariae]QXP77694.1 serine acetyltransferase [Winogradskyella sp. HaHa_3_26]